MEYPESYTFCGVECNPVVNHENYGLKGKSFVAVLPTSDINASSWLDQVVGYICNRKKKIEIASSGGHKCAHVLRLEANDMIPQEHSVLIIRLEEEFREKSKSTHSAFNYMENGVVMTPLVGIVKGVKSAIDNKWIEFNAYINTDSDYSNSDIDTESIMDILRDIRDSISNIDKRLTIQEESLSIMSNTVMNTHSEQLRMSLKISDLMMSLNDLRRDVLTNNN